MSFDNLRTLTRSRTIPEPVSSRAALAGVAVALVRGVFPLAKKVRLLGVAVSGFEAGSERAPDSQATFDFGEPSQGEQPRA